MSSEINRVPVLVKVTTTIQLLIAVSYTALAVYMFVFAPPASLRAGSRSSELMVNIALIGFMVVVPWLAFGALLIRKPWGWGLAMTFALYNLIAIVGGHLADRTWPEKSEILIGLFFVAFGIWLQVSPVRRFFKTQTTSKRKGHQNNWRDQSSL